MFNNNNPFEQAINPNYMGENGQVPPPENLPQGQGLDVNQILGALGSMSQNVPNMGNPQQQGNNELTGGGTRVNGIPLSIFTTLNKPTQSNIINADPQRMITLAKLLEMNEGYKQKRSKGDVPGMSNIINKYLELYKLKVDEIKDNNPNGM